MAAWWETLVASLGGVVGLILFLAPMKAVLRARADRVLGDLNPLPFPVLVGNCAGWVAYGFVTDDVLVLWPNVLGVLIALFYTLSVYGLADIKTRDRQAASLLVFSSVLMVVGSVGALGDLGYDSLKRLWGFTANAILIIFYAAPLSTVMGVLRTRSSATLNLPLSVMNIINGGLWLVYGLAITDYFIAVPNGVGALLGLVYCALICAFPRRSSKHSPSPSDTDPGSSRKDLLAASSAEQEQEHVAASGGSGTAAGAGPAGTIAGAAMHEYYHTATANIHKGVEHELRQVCWEWAQVCFTRNATEALNMVAHGWGMHNLKEGDEILMSVAEHHSSLAPWQMVAEKTGAVIKDVELTPDTQEIDLADLQAKLSDKTKIVVLVHISNVLGCVLPAEEACRVAHQAGALVLLDSCQYLPHRRTDVQRLGADWIVASGHKFLAPTASGFLWGRFNLLSKMEPLMVGGSTTGEIHYGMHTDVAPPMRFEAGTPAIAEAIGLGAAVDYLNAVGMEAVEQYEHELSRLLYQEVSALPGVRVLGPPPSVPMGRASLVAFTVDGCDVMQLAADLDKIHHIAVSAGHHRAKPLHEDYLKIGPTLRASAYVYNTPQEVRRFAAALREGIEARRGGGGGGGSIARARGSCKQS
ncbi:cysteine desulfurase [Micractinium conductrix]|uniref:Sugar transporter SWEET1 n=1 Tax=Micractinium conductrix TaxID=554055 RepID=A0A2P6VA99_9CHLO|nr:cysteine desulfurase [Micractinium conductrix]|eukprot:PSC71016.1 cysteine desulfurase [Micractinium conductrix]